MSLIKLNAENRIKESWWDKKSIKRLDIILFKSRKNYNTLSNTIDILKSYNLPIDENIEKLYNSWIYRSAQLDNIIYHKKLKR
jgi:hypothetical protein